MRILRRVVLGTVLGLVALAGGGCGGFTASRSVSPATFLLPGLMQAVPETAPAAPASVPATLAQAGGR